MSVTFNMAPGGALQGTLRVPGDKSVSHRSVMLGALADGVTEVDGFLEGADSLATLAAFGPVHGPWRWNASIGHRTFDSVREVVDNGITLNSLAGGVDGRVKNWRVGGATGFTDFSDSNNRLHFTGYALYPWELSAGVDVEAGYRFRWMSYDVNLDSGYFDPQSFTSNVATVKVSGPLGTPRADWEVRLEGGVQSFTIDPNAPLPGEKQSNDTIFAWQVRLGWDIKSPLRLEAYYGESDFAVQSGTGFESEQWGVLLRYRF